MENAKNLDAQTAPTSNTVPFLVSTTPTNSTVNSSTNAPAPAADAGKTASATPALPANLTQLSPGMAEIIKLAQANVGEEVLQAYITNSVTVFKATADEILYLTDLGVSEPSLALLLNKKAPGTVTTLPREGTTLIPTNPPATPQPPVAATAQAPTSTPAPGVLQQQLWQQNNVYPTDNQPIEPNAPSYAVTSGAAVQVEEPAPQQAVTVQYFQQSLAPYGSWVEVPGYGNCWQPYAMTVNPHWRPYADRGNWVYTDQGWYWHSDYSWGWAPFHYGRWFHASHRGWVWSPDTQWGPAWVSWRNGVEHCGWAPLPPAARYRSGVGFTYHNASVGVSFEFGLSEAHYTFVPTSRFHERGVYRHALSHHQTAAVYQRSTVVNNYIVGNNNVIINEGIGRDRVARASHREIERVAIRDAAPSGNRKEVLDTHSRTLQVFRPRLAGSAPRRSASEVTPASLVTAPETGREAGQGGIRTPNRTVTPRTFPERPGRADAETPRAMTPVASPRTPARAPAVKPQEAIVTTARPTPDVAAGTGPAVTPATPPVGSSGTPPVASAGTSTSAENSSGARTRPGIRRPQTREPITIRGTASAPTPSTLTPRANLPTATPAITPAPLPGTPAANSTVAGNVAARRPAVSPSATTPAMTPRPAITLTPTPTLTPRPSSTPLPASAQRPIMAQQNVNPSPAQTQPQAQRPRPPAYSAPQDSSTMGARSRGPRYNAPESTYSASAPSYSAPARREMPAAAPVMTPRSEPAPSRNVAPAENRSSSGLSPRGRDRNRDDR